MEWKKKKNERYGRSNQDESEENGWGEGITIVDRVLTKEPLERALSRLSVCLSLNK